MAGANRCICERSSDYHFISCAKQSFLPVSQKLFKNMKTQAGDGLVGKALTKQAKGCDWSPGSV